MKIKKIIKNIIPASISQINHLEQIIDSVQEKINTQQIFWKNDIERNMVKGNFGDVMTDPDFASKFTRLISGMDADSIDILIRIILRQHLYLTDQSTQLDFFTEKEKLQLRKLNDEFYSAILKISNNLYAYRNYFLPVNHFEASVFYYKHGVSSVKTISKVKNRTIIDVGGFVGDSALILSELMPQTIYTFEPVSQNYKKIQETIRLNNLKNIVPVNYGLGDQVSQMTIHVSTGGGGSSINERYGMAYVKEEVINVTTLDEYVRSNRVEDIALIKVDIEGAEPLFLEGAKQTICKHRPILLLSIYHNANDFFGIKPLVESWDLGYTFRIFKPVFENTTAETLLIAEVLQ